MKRRAGVTLIELLVSITIIAILTAAISRAFAAGIDYDTRLSASRERLARRIGIEERIAELLRQATLSTDPTDPNTFFLGTTSGNQAGSTSSDTLTFTTMGSRLPGPVLASTDDFETQNDRLGPQGGPAEISLSTTAVGDAADKSGLFLRQQHPSDGDPTQGGMESVLDPDMTSISFEFYDGTTWQPQWTTQAGETKRLPAAVRVTYSLVNEDESTPHVFVVRLPMSDVTADDPADAAATSPTGAGQ